MKTTTTTTPGAPRPASRSIGRIVAGEITGVSTLASAARRAVAGFRDGVAPTHRELQSLAAGIAAPAQRRFRTETFDAAVARLGLSEADIAARGQQYRRHALLTTFVAWMFVAAAAGAAISGEWLWAANSFAGIPVFVALALRSWFCLERIQQRRFFHFAEFVRTAALRRMLFA